MASFDIEFRSENPDTANIRVDDRFDISIIRTPEGLTLKVYPISFGQSWMDPFDTLTVDEGEVLAAERAMEVKP